MTVSLSGRAVILAIAAITAGACTMGPRYRRLTLAVPEAHRGSGPRRVETSKGRLT